MPSSGMRERIIVHEQEETGFMQRGVKRTSLSAALIKLTHLLKSPESAVTACC